MVRAVLLLGLAGCFGSMDANGRPAVMPKLSELPADPAKRDAVLDQANDTNGPEGKPIASKKERKAVTAAAFAAAIVGEMFSKTEKVTFGSATTIDENRVGGKAPQKRTPGSPTTTTPPDPGLGSAVPDEPAQDATTLTPWIKLK